MTFENHISFRRYYVPTWLYSSSASQLLSVLLHGIFQVVTRALLADVFGLDTVYGQGEIHLNTYIIHAIITAYSRGLSSLLLSSIFLIVNIMAYTGILRSGSWHEKHQNKSYKLVYPWICLYFIANCGIVPIGEYTIQSF